MFTLINGILWPYFPKSSPDREYLLRFVENSDINSLYFSLNGGHRHNNAIFYPYIFARVKSIRKAQAQKMDILFLLALVCFSPSSIPALYKLFPQCARSFVIIK
ncbi:Uncharacterised protein [Paenibacillus macerans]|uniref:Uncharacterized protein n=1 Tax=Paenibacillus macerans TaxID=44252 RepID=A0A091A4S2_PAEMA|nr:hypothetical protein DJ90_2379 [Paenibacillus macerans]SUD26683.1 Uncharacterised protein [Paenibacillus macerans]